MLVLLRECWELFALAIGLKPQLHISHHGSTPLASAGTMQELEAECSFFPEGLLNFSPLVCFRTMMMGMVRRTTSRVTTPMTTATAPQPKGKSHLLLPGSAGRCDVI